MLAAGTIRRIRQTMMATNLAQGALVAWQVPEEKLQAAFDWMFQQDPFSGHVVIRSTDAGISATRYRLWTTLKVPSGYSIAKHCDYLCQKTGATSYRWMPAKRLFALGVGHMRRRGMEPGSKSDEVADVLDTNIVELLPTAMASTGRAEARIYHQRGSRKLLVFPCRRGGHQLGRILQNCP